MKKFISAIFIQVILLAFAIPTSLMTPAFAATPSADVGDAFFGFSGDHSLGGSSYEYIQMDLDSYAPNVLANQYFYSTEIEYYKYTPAGDTAMVWGNVVFSEGRFLFEHNEIRPQGTGTITIRNVPITDVAGVMTSYSSGTGVSIKMIAACKIDNRISRMISGLVIVQMTGNIYHKPHDATLWVLGGTGTITFVLTSTSLRNWEHYIAAYPQGYD